MLTPNDLDYFTNQSNRMTPAEAAKYLKRTPKTLAQWRYCRIGPPYIKIGRSVYYDKRILDAWLESRTQVFMTDWKPLIASKRY